MFIRTWRRLFGWAYGISNFEAFVLFLCALSSSRAFAMCCCGGTRSCATRYRTCSAHVLCGGGTALLLLLPLLPWETHDMTRAARKPIARLRWEGGSPRDVRPT